MTLAPRRPDDDEPPYLGWFLAFLADRAIRKPSRHTTKAYRQDFVAIATLLAGDPGRVVQLTPGAITKDAMRAAFAVYATPARPHRSGAAGPTETHVVRLSLLR